MASKAPKHPANGYPVHPFAELFPLHEGPSLDALHLDIEKHGQSEKITLWKAPDHLTYVLDGRRRQACCINLRIRPKYRMWHGSEEEALRYVYTMNLKRRHLDQGERALMAAKRATAQLGFNQHGKNSDTAAAEPSAPTMTREEAADALNVSTDAVDRAKTVLKSGTPALQDAVKDGTVTLTDAAKVAKEAPAVQDAAVDAVRTGAAPTAAAAVAPEIDWAKVRAAINLLLSVPDDLYRLAGLANSTGTVLEDTTHIRLVRAVKDYDKTLKKRRRELSEPKHLFT